MTQAINLANFSNSLDSSGGVPPTQLNAVVPVSKGGTNASTAAAARTNLGSTTVGDAVFIATSTANARSAIGAVIGTDIPSPTGTGASGTWAINISGSLYATQPTIGYSISGQNITYGGQGGPMVQSQGSGAAMMSFHRPGSYAINFGLDTDNVVKLGGWSAGTVAYPVLTSNNVGTYTIGIDQTWQNVIGSRSNGVTYTNSTGRPILVAISGASTTNTGFILTIDSVIVASTGWYSLAGGQVLGNACGIVPSGKTYSVTGWNSGSSGAAWAELR
jgi:hypothetical protein